jgi:membrane protease YdiL (CAAX protease family)
MWRGSAVELVCAFSSSIQSRSTEVLSVIRKHPLVAFFVLAYALSWWPWPLYAAGVPGEPFLSFGPLVAAVIVLAVTAGRPGLRALVARMLRWRVRWYWYAVALALPLTVDALASAINVALGAPAPTFGPGAPWYSVIMVFAIRLVNPLDGPLGEEPGWRGFALPNLQVTRSPLIATTILALLVTGWHLPLVLGSGSNPLPPFALLGTFAGTFWFTWVFNHTNGSVLLTLIMHAADATLFGLPTAGLGRADLERALLLKVVLVCVVTIGLCVFDRQAWRFPAPALARSNISNRQKNEN